MARLVPSDLAELRDAVGGALAVAEPVEIVAGGSKRGLGRPLQTPHLLDLSRLAGIRDDAPSELVLTAGAATPLAEIERVLAENHQMLAFEPPNWRDPPEFVRLFHDGDDGRWVPELAPGRAEEPKRAS